MSELTTQQPSLRDRLTRFATLSTMSDLFADRVKQERIELTADLAANFEETGSPSVVLALPGVPKAATATVTQETDKAIVSDALAFKEWIAEAIADSVEVKIEVRANVQKALLEKGVELVEDGSVVWKQTGETIPGLSVKKAGPPTKFSVTGKNHAAFAEAARSANLFDLLAATPEVEAGATIVGEVIAPEAAQA